MDNVVRESLIAAFEEFKWLHSSIAELKADFMALERSLLTPQSTVESAFQKRKAANRAEATLAIGKSIQDFDEIIRKLKGP
jgi:hypothetical protein